jgi:hypothetical protein
MATTKKKSTKQLEREIADLSHAEHPPHRGTTMEVDGWKHAIVPASIESTRTPYDKQVMRATSKTLDDAWLVMSPNGEDVLGAMVGNGDRWSIYRRSGGGTWKRDQVVEPSLRGDITGDWRTVARAIAKYEV